MWRRVIVVFAKEVVDNYRDRRSLLLALVYPLMGPVLLGVMIALVTGLVLAYPRDQVRLWVQGGEFAPELMSYLESEGATIRPAPPDPEAQVRRGRIKHVVVIGETFGTEFAAQRPATVKLFVNTSRLSAGLALSFEILETEFPKPGGRSPLLYRLTLSLCCHSDLLFNVTLTTQQHPQ